MRNTSARARVDNAHPFRSSDIIDQPPCAILPLFAAASGSFVRSRHRHFSPSRLLVRIGRYFCPAGHCRCTDGLGTRFTSFEDRRDRREEDNNKRSWRYFSPVCRTSGLLIFVIVSFLTRSSYSAPRVSFVFWKFPDRP